MKTFAVLSLLVAAAVAAPTLNGQQVVPEKAEKANGEITEEHVRQLQQLTKLIPRSESAELREKALELAMNALNKKEAEIEGDDGEDSSEGDDDVVTTLTDIVNTLTTINGMNSLGVDSTDVANTAVGMGEVEVMVGSSGDTVRTEIGDLVNTIGAIQGFWYNYDIANVNVILDRDD